ncbi:UvrD-helicase domain-containing protein [Neolewinella antarctica]|uniref:DNA 3'-5' helicase n=1 Tax=Neolewinella antarctica TaxID=442734 RepID=A0ABX0X7B6_9BACT|nr:UvrD-helicase domain-containing protein [Neolewinella antarctica]NJC25105.1 ATP-dependent exoDNAse (exonuclease V) beta subunit [Neolewinella antarctica]
MAFDNLKLISAGAGSGKTYRLTEELSALLTAGDVKPSGIIATTFTKRAAAELRERVRVKLLREGMSREANELKNALIGTVHGLGVKLLKRFAFEAGVSPQVDIIADQDHQRLFNLSMASAIEVDDIERIEALCERLSLSRDGEIYNWRRDVLRLVEVLRGNNFSPEDIQRSKTKSWTSLQAFLPEVNTKVTDEQFRNRLKIALTETIAALESNDADSTKTTQGGISILKRLHFTLKRGDNLPWAELATLANFAKKVAVKSKDRIALVTEIGELHAALPAFQDDLRDYIYYTFDFADRAIREYDTYKKARGRIDYTDMEVLVLDLLGNPMVEATLRDELDLLIVDEFQDTSPIQLALFLKLSKLAKKSIWVGDPKQSIYGFRGAEPRLMKAVMDATGPIKPENIQTKSWRSRQDIVHACNAIFTKGFPEIAEEAVVLEPVRLHAGNEELNKAAESPELAERSGIIHWSFKLEGKARYSKDWFADVTAKGVAEMLANPPLIIPKDGGGERRLIAADIAVLCRTNYECVRFAKALANQGINAAIARTGLLSTAEATLLLACLKYLLNSNDNLAVAEILLFGSRESLPDIIDHRLNYLEVAQSGEKTGHRWAVENKLLIQLNELREITGEYSSNELINILLERLDLRRIMVAWGDGEQRLANIDEMRRLAVEYEDNCHRQHRAASLPGYFLYLDGLKRGDGDKQGAGERPDAVNILTYHRSKGLEWPAVITMQLDQKPRADVWGMAVVPETETVDLEDPLANRWIKYWVQPYGRLSSGVPWLDALAESQWQEAATESELAEETRLLYVGMTRARDYLIMPTAKPGAPWLDRVFQRGGGLVPVLDPESNDAPFNWRGNEVHKELKRWTEPRNIPGQPLSYREVPFIDGPRPGRRDYLAAGTDLAWLLDRYAARTLAGGEVYHTLPEIDPEVNARIYGQAIAAFLAGDIPTLPTDLREERAQELLNSYLPTSPVPVTNLIQQADAFAAWTAGKGARSPVQRSEQLQATIDGRLIDLTADWLISTPAGSILIKDVHLPLKTFEEQDDQRKLYGAELALLDELVGQVTGAVPHHAYLHLPLAGKLFALK